MKPSGRLILVVALCASSATAFASEAQPTFKDLVWSMGGAAVVEPTLRRVVLSSGGVAYMEREATVDGDGRLELDVPLEQVDDVLKSVVVYDPSGGAASVRLAGLDADDRTFSGLPFGKDAFDSPDALINALQGAVVTTGDRVSGRIVKSVAETAVDERGATVTRHRVSLLTSSGLQQFVLESAKSVAFVDPTLQARVEDALAAVAQRGGSDLRRVTLDIRGKGARKVRVGYVVAAPLWKASYRLTLPYADGPKAHVQGWAVLENMSGQDWNDVEMTLVSGDPVSFRQAIYRSYYLRRPEVPVEVEGHVLPEPDRGGVRSPVAARVPGSHGPTDGDMDLPRRALAKAMTSAAPAGDGRPQSQVFSDAADGAIPEEGATQVSFRLPVPVTVRSGQSAMVPILDKDLGVERVDLYRPGAGEGRPLSSLRVRNDTATGLPPGVLTVYDEAKDGIEFVGDARLADLPVGESRLLSFAVDERTKVVRSERTVLTTTGASVAGGMLRLRQSYRLTYAYRIAAPAAEARRVVLETPKTADWSLVEPESGVEETGTAYRSSVDLKAGETRTVTVVLERPTIQATRVADWDDAQASASAVHGAIGPAIRAALDKVAALRREVARARATQARIAEALGRLADDQSRIRLDLAQVDKESDLHRRYVDKLGEQENDFESYRLVQADAARAVEKAQAALDAYVGDLDL